MKFLAVALLAMFILSCGHHRDVRPAADGNHRVMLQHEDKDGAAREAMEQANHFCKQYEKYAAVVDEKTTYTGSMSEKDYQTTKTVGNVAKTVGGAAWVFGGKRESNAGGIVGLGGMAADAAAGKGYTIDMRFKCQ